MKTVEEIVKRCHASNPDDPFGFGFEVLSGFLTFEEARPLLKVGATGEGWESCPLTSDSVKAAMRTYMEFAWGKARDHRGLSASRSIVKMKSFIWLLGDENTLCKVNVAGYARYGAPKLAVICETYGFPIPSGDDVANMIAGKACCPYCEEGCGQ